ncbi:hypothetical protein QA646_29690 (plasmid) [Rhizobium sp. CB3090]|uniref:hypothetical protein n=1 Tax=Rhizobium sp. CB3090 TaxID=3039156 RepID=UPI0024B13EC2|nr:hypothetical protein [Rhizobium sp. CB3090]WFU13380.1 hypothetical protein QA646_29690 [Rhizobium sp. CB3090]
MRLSGNGIHGLEGCYDQLLSWCDLLEAVADFLPCHIDDRFCETITKGLLTCLNSTYDREEQEIASRLSLIMTGEEMAEEIERMKMSRVFGRKSAQDVVDVLVALKKGKCPLSWDAVGHLLRSFFCPMRSHIKEERQLVERIRKALEAAALAQRTDVATEAA